MMIDGTQDLRDRYRSFLEQSLTDEDIDVRADVQPTDKADLVKARLAFMFQAKPDLQRIAVQVEGRLVGIATRNLVLDSETLAGGGLGEGDGAAFPLDSGEFRLIRFACPAPSCPSHAFAAFFDEREVPHCANHGASMRRL